MAAETVARFVPCTLQTCPVEKSYTGYDPSLAGNLLYLFVFAFLLVIQAFYGIRFRTWAYLVALTGGLVLEIIGYVARVQLHMNPFQSGPFLMYLITLTIAPCFLNAGIYLCFARVVAVYGEQYSRLSPKTYTRVFVTCDVVSLVLQGVGGAVADTSGNVVNARPGINAMIAGLAFQVASLLFFSVLCADFACSVWKRHRIGPQELMTRLTCSVATFHRFLAALALATLLLLIRSSYRVAELSQGLSGPLARSEATFMVLEGAMIVVASAALTVAHPGFVFGRAWRWASLVAKPGTSDVSLESSRSVH